VVVNDPTLLELPDPQVLPRFLPERLSTGTQISPPVGSEISPPGVIN
jgi:hypothetical protein